LHLDEVEFVVDRVGGGTRGIGLPVAQAVLSWLGTSKSS
jgi:hypothetical protein